MLVKTLIVACVLAIVATMGQAFYRAPISVAPATKRFMTLWDLPIASRSPIAREMRDILDVIRNCDVQPAQLNPTLTPSRMQMDVKETEKSYEIAIDVPGVDKKDISITIEDNTLTISSHREAAKKEEGDTFKRVERFSGTSTRTMSLPENVDQDSIEARNENGVLHLTIPKKPVPEVEPAKIIQVK